MQRRTVLSAPLCLTAFGCASALKLPNIDPDATLPAGHGLLVTRALLSDASPGMSQRPDVSITLIDVTNLTVASAILPLSPGENFRAIALPAATYTWRGIYLGTYSSEFRGKLPFKIEAGKACYVGDLDLQIDWRYKTYKLAVKDRSRIAQSRFEAEYPKLAGNLPFEVSLATDLRGL
ncbi:hypothetical protein [Ideonella sp. YS5]|uniref:hypothetical protein n=1 Tax=Ideonella sp. YS5 TaxID=3453714 RepID=UPI003EE8C97A